MRAIGYARVSTEDQARDGCSLAAQQTKLEAHQRRGGRLGSVCWRARGWLIDTTQPSGVGSIAEVLVWTDSAGAQ